MNCVTPVLSYVFIFDVINTVLYHFWWFHAIYSPNIPFLFGFTQGKWALHFARGFSLDHSTTKLFQKHYFVY